MNWEILPWIGLFFISYMGVYLSSDKLIDRIEETGEKLRIPSFALGILLLGIDLEESIVSLIAASTDLPKLAIGNIIGNTIFAIGIVFGIAPLFMKFEYEQIPKKYYLFVIIGASVVVGTIFTSHSKILGIFLLFLFIAYVSLTIFEIRKYRNSDSFIKNIKTSNSALEEEKEKPKIIIISLLIVSLAFLLVSGELLVRSAKMIMTYTGIEEGFFGLIITAFITNAEEFWLMLNSIKKKKTHLGISAQIGKILWNITLIYGLSFIMIKSFRPTPAMLQSTIIFFFLTVLTILYLWKQKMGRLQATSILAIVLIFVSLNVYYLTI